MSSRNGKVTTWQSIGTHLVLEQSLIKLRVTSHQIRADAAERVQRLVEMSLSWQQVIAAISTYSGCNMRVACTWPVDAKMTTDREDE